MLDDDLVAVELDLLDNEPDDLLALWNRQGSGSFWQRAQEALEAVGHPQPGFLVEKLCFDRF